MKKKILVLSNKFNYYNIVECRDWTDLVHFCLARCLPKYHCVPASIAYALLFPCPLCNE